MTMNVGQAFLDNPKKRQRQFARQPVAETSCKLRFDFNFAALGKTIHVPGQRRLQAHFIEQGRMQKMRISYEFPARLVR